MSDNNLQRLIADAVSFGCYDASRSLGIAKMPDGYALMLNPDRSHFFWLRSDGIESCNHWNKWAVYRWAKNESVQPLSRVKADTTDETHSPETSEK